MGGVGQEFVQSELSRSDQGPPRALLEIRRKAGLRNERCMPLLQMLDQLGRSRLPRRPTPVQETFTGMHKMLACRQRQCHL